MKSKNSLAPALIGQVLVADGVLSEVQAEQALTYSRENKIRFGEAATKLRFAKPGEIRQALAIQFGYPIVDRQEAKLPAELLLAFHPFGAKGKAVRALRNQLLADDNLTLPLSLMVVAPDKTASAAWVASNLYIAFSQLGNSTLLVDADTRQSEITDWFKLQSPIGLSSLLVRRAPIQGVLHRQPQFRNLTIIGSGVQPPNPLDVFVRPELRSLIRYAGSKYQVTIVNAGVFDSNLSQAVSAATGNVLMVTKQNRTNLDNVERMAAELRFSGANVVGAVMLRG